MYQAMKKAALATPKALAVYYQGTKIHYSKFLKLVDRTADILANRLNIIKGDTVLLSQPNIPDVLIIFYALNKIGAITDFLHPFTPFNQTESVFEKTHCKYAFLFEQRIAKEVESYRLISDRIFVTRIEDYLPLFKKFVYHFFMNKKIRKKLGKYHGGFKGFKYFYALKPTHKIVREANNESDEVAVLLHSGSTTGTPKTICLNNDSFNFLGYHAPEFLCLDKKDVVNKAMLSVLPSFHGFGLCMTMHDALINSFATALVPKFSVEAVIDCMNHTKLMSMCGIPGIYEKLAASEEFRSNPNIKNLHICFCGGDKMNATLKERFDKVMKDGGSECRVFEGYGLTEAIAVNCVNTFTHFKEGSIGYPASGFSFKIIDDNGNALKANEQGEICVKSPANMLHYFEDPKATEATFTNDGYLKTGDIGYIDEDDFIFFKQRRKRVVKVSGVGVFPSEVEQLIESIPAVSACCAIRIPDPKLVSAIKVFVVAKYFDEVGMKREIMDTCKKYLIRWSVPTEIEFRDELPITMLGKVDFMKLQKEEDAKRGVDSNQLD